VKPTSSPHDQEIIEALESLKSQKAEYPPELLAARRAAFIGEIVQRREAAAKEAQHAQDQQVIEVLESLKSVKAEYPSELLAARRAAFISEIVQRRAVLVEEAQPSQNRDVIEILETLKADKIEYPPELFAARRTAFIRQVTGEEALTGQDENVIKLLENLKTARAEYPARLLTARRAAFVRQVRGWGGVSLLEVLRSILQRQLSFMASILSAPMMKSMRTSLVVVGLLAATFIASLLGDRTLLTQIINPSPTQIQVSRPNPVSATSTQELQTTICKPGYSPPLCLAKKFDTSQDLTYQGNGAQPAVAKDTLPGHSGIHKAAYINDGHYGNGASWISNSPYSWIKIDLGEVKAINTVEFGRDRLGNYNDRDPGQFTIAVALADNIYADGNSSQDNIEYTLVYDSERAGFTGRVAGAETVTAYFDSVTARFVKITFANPGTAIDEVEVFMLQPALILSDEQTERPNNRPPRATATPLPTNTLRPTSTPLPTDTPTDIPTDTPVPPTDTPQPTDTPVPPTDTPQPTDTPTDVPPTDTPLPPIDPTTAISADTPMPEPTP
jgi:hypothetical protein